ncbi:MAG: hypothetical protein V4545_11050 [Pseudomonadota bacterium]
MKNLYVFGACLVLLHIGACTQPMPRYDSEFGNTIRNTMNAQVIDPKAGSNPDPVAGLDGRAARDAINNYQKSFAKPEPTPNVFSLGIGNSSGGSGN